MIVQSYLCFEGRCDEAIEFYRSALDAEVEMLMRFKESPDPTTCSSDSGDLGEKVMHASIRIGETQLMASDGNCQGPAKFEGISLSLSVDDEAEARRVFDALSDGGQVKMPLAKTFFSPLFGMVADRFGVSWLVITATEKNSADQAH